MSTTHSVFPDSEAQSERLESPEMGAEQSTQQGAAAAEPAANGTGMESAASAAAAAPQEQQDGASSAALLGGGGGSSKRPKALVIVGPSGVGKGTLISKLTEEAPEQFGFSVSHTTRAPRTGEKVSAEALCCGSL